MLKKSTYRKYLMDSPFPLYFLKERGTEGVSFLFPITGQLLNHDFHDLQD